jgi:DNA invertase Pin-like site-specific DNA recombinase
MTAVAAYARVSTGSQTEASQVDQLTTAGFDRLWIDHGTHGDIAPQNRPVMVELLDWVRPGDVLLTVDMTRLGRSSVQALVFMDHLVNERQVNVRTIREGIDTTTAHGQLLAGLFSAISAWELSLIRARTREGIAAARQRGVKFGRPTVVSPDRRDAILAMRRDGMTQAAIGRTLGIGTTTVQRVLTAAQDDVALAAT